MKVLLLSPLSEYSGNFATISRIKKGLEKKGLQCFLKCPLEISSSKELECMIENLDINIMLAVHVFKSGKFLADVQTPYILILGGTDVNELTSDLDKMEIMTKAVNNSRHVVAFGESLSVKFKSCWPDYSSFNVSIIPQGVEVCPSSFSITQYVQNNPRKVTTEQNHTRRVTTEQNHTRKVTTEQNHTRKVTTEQTHTRKVTTEQNGHLECLYACEPETFLGQLKKTESKIFTVVGGIRTVKNPLFLIKQFSEWRVKHERLTCWLLFVGANQNDAYFEGFKEEVLRCPGVVYIPGLRTEDTHAIIQDSFVLVNCSDSEGMALSILEAMALKTLVIARNIPGNIAIVQDGQTGVIFDTPENFLEKAENLLEDQERVKSITQNAFTYISEKHSVANEENAYFSLVKKYC